MITRVYEAEVKRDFVLHTIRFWEGETVGITNVSGTIYWDIVKGGKRLFTLTRDELKL